MMKLNMHAFKPFYSVINQSWNFQSPTSVGQRIHDMTTDTNVMWNVCYGDEADILSIVPKVSECWKTATGAWKVVSWSSYPQCLCVNVVGY